ncbi:TlpA family protein disulfide reductase [Lysobacter sp. CW239]|nr:TlpA family protein disulfide reductase [Lysobacter sp. CW239]
MPRSDFPMRTVVAAALLAGLLSACQPSTAPDTEDAVAPAPATPPSASEEAAPAGTKPAPAGDVTHPKLVLTTLDGATYDLAAHRGKWVVVNFWATWCAPCLKEMPELSALDAMREHIEVVGLAYEDIEPAEMKAFLLEHPVVYPIAIVDTYDPPADFDTPRGLPMTYVIAPDGSVASKILGPVTAQDIEDVVAAADAAQPARATAPEST